MGNQYCFNFQSIDISLSIDFSDNYTFLSVSESTCETEEFVVFELTSVSNKFSNSKIVEIQDQDENRMGYLIVGDDRYHPISSSPRLITSYLSYFILSDEINSNGHGDNVMFPQDFETSDRYENRSLLFIEKELLNDYLEFYSNGSELWGGFSHKSISNLSYNKIEKVKAIKNIKLPTQEHEAKAYYSTTSNNSFIRFLNKYQIIELLFDYLVVAKLRVLPRNDIISFRSIMNNYGKEEIKILKDIITENLTDLSGLSQQLYKFSNYYNISHEIFQKHSKDSNPLKDESRWNKFWDVLNESKLNVNDVSSDKKYQFSGSIKSNENDKLLVDVGNIVSYWIYRVRCSIAHNKIGEYIFSDSDECFVFEACEPLLDEVLKQILTNNDLNEILEKSKIIESHL